MKIFLKLVLFILALLAASSGVAKIMLMPQEVDFFGQYGFTNSILITFGITQFIGGLLLLFPKMRIIGALIVALTFLISAVLLLISKNIPVALVTLMFVALTALIAKQPSGVKKTH